jgi:hypothetical protein
MGVFRVFFVAKGRRTFLHLKKDLLAERAFSR